jgi:hypothetical protein
MTNTKWTAGLMVVREGSAAQAAGPTTDRPPWLVLSRLTPEERSAQALDRSRPPTAAIRADQGRSIGREQKTGWCLTCTARHSIHRVRLWMSLLPAQLLPALWPRPLLESLTRAFGKQVPEAAPTIADRSSQRCHHDWIEAFLVQHQLVQAGN